MNLSIEMVVEIENFKRDLFSKKPPILLVVSAIVVVLAAVFMLFIILRPQVFKYVKKEVEELIIENEPNNLVARKLDGVLVSAGEEDLYPLAVMIDNFVEARPTSGLARAQLVYEAPTEANISRFMAIYTTAQEVAEIGPVRSARPYYLDWVLELDALYAHVGGSPEALEKIDSYDVYDINEYYNQYYFWRDHSKYSPHNVYSSTELLSSYLAEGDVSDYEPWLFKEEVELAERPQEVEVLSFQFRDEDYFVEWKYDRKNNDYVRWQASAVQTDEKGTEIRAKNIAVQYVKIWILDEIGRRKIETIGKGEAVVFQDGRVIEGFWQKKERAKRTRFYDEDGWEIEFNPGTTWIEVIPSAQMEMNY